MGCYHSVDLVSTEVTYFHKLKCMLFTYSSLNWIHKTFHLKFGILRLRVYEVTEIFEIILIPTANSNTSVSSTVLGIENSFDLYNNFIFPSAFVI